MVRIEQTEYAYSNPMNRRQQRANVAVAGHRAAVKEAALRRCALARRWQEAVGRQPIVFAQPHANRRARGGDERAAA